jgi:membrane-bound lytic murein transglycosylase A
MINRLRFSFISLVWLTIVAGSLLVFFYFEKDCYQPLHRLRQNQLPVLTDDFDRTSLIECSRKHLSILKSQNPDNTTFYGTDTYTNRWLVHSVESFLEKLQQNPSSEELRRFLDANYLVYQAGGNKDSGARRMLVTGYYEPIFEGSFTRQKPYLTPIYSLPPSLITVTGNNGESQIGRYDFDHQLIAFWSRKEIETTFELLQGSELVFLKDPFDAFLLHVQGSGKIQFSDNTTRAVHYAGSNGLDYKSIGKLLVDEKAMSLEEVTIPAIRAYLQQHPDQLQRILHHNPRFIFFEWGDDLGPKGSSGEVLTPGRSIALDSTALPAGSIGFLATRVPQFDEQGQLIGWRPFTRFVFPQDSGAAIKGTGRVDVFFGHGKEAEFAAHHMKEDGKLYFLVKNPSETPH